MSPLLCGGGHRRRGDEVIGSTEAGDGKADFNYIYDRPDPRDYFRTLGEFDYEIPQRAQRAEVVPRVGAVVDVVEVRLAVSCLGASDHFVSSSSVAPSTCLLYTSDAADD